MLESYETRGSSCINFKSDSTSAPEASMVPLLLTSLIPKQETDPFDNSKLFSALNSEQEERFVEKAKQFTSQVSKKMTVSGFIISYIAEFKGSVDEKIAYFISLFGEPMGYENCFKDESFFVIGEFSRFTKEEIEKLILVLGGKIVNDLGENPRYFLHGHPGAHIDSEYRRFKRKYGAILDEANFLDMVKHYILCCPGATGRPRPPYGEDYFGNKKSKKPKESSSLNSGGSPLHSKPSRTVKNFVLTGDFRYLKRSEFLFLIHQRGGVAYNEVDFDTDYLVVGSNASSELVKKAEELNVKIVKEEQFEEFMRELYIHCY